MCNKDLPLHKVMIPGFRCCRCGHLWVARKRTSEPTVCPNCKSPYWNRAKRGKGAKS